MIKLNFGSGSDIKNPVEWDNADINPSVKLDYCFDFEKFPYPFKKNYYDYVLVREVLEHLENPADVLFELWKHIKSNGIIEIEVPHYTNRGAYDFYHKNYFDSRSFERFVEQGWVENPELKFEIVELKLIPTWVGRLLVFNWLRENLSLFLGGLIESINVKLRVIKNES